MTQADRSDRYEVGEALEKVGRTQRFAATEKSSGTAVVLHRVMLKGLDANRDAILADLALEAQVRDARIPPLFDAWVADEDVCYVRREFDGAKLDSAAARNRIMSSGRDPMSEMAYHTLAALAALHDSVLSHKRLNIDCYRVTEAGVVVLHDTGIWDRVNHRAQLGQNALAQVSLVSNIERIDVACWGAMIVNLITGGQFEIHENDDGVLEAQPEDVTAMTKVVEESCRNDKFAKLVIKSLGAFENPEGGGYENAGEALQDFPRMALA